MSTLRDELSRVYDELVSEDEKTEVVTEEQPQQEEVVQEEKNEDQPAEEPKVEEKEPVEEKEAVADKEVKDDTPAVAVETPGNLTREQRELFDKLPSDAKATFADIVKRQEAAHTRRSQQLAEKTREYEQLDAIFTPSVKQELGRMGHTTDSYIRHLASWQQSLFTNPQQSVMQLLNEVKARTGFDVFAGAEQPQFNQQSQGGMLSIDHLPPQVQKIVRESEERERRQQIEMQMQKQSAEDEVIDFLADVNNVYVQPDSEYRVSVINKMEALMRSGEAKTIRDAYECALYATPDIRARLTAEQQHAAAEMASKNKQIQDAANNAKKAAAINTHGLSGAKGNALQTPKASKSLAEELSDVWDQLVNE